MLERSQDWENNAITMSRLVECSQAGSEHLMAVSSEYESLINKAARSRLFWGTSSVNMN